jgi:hypothetical protein
MPRRSPHTRLTLLLAMLTVPAACDDPRNPIVAGGGLRGLRLAPERGRRAPT